MVALRDPFFWALVSMFGLVAACVVVSGRKLGRRLWFGIATVLLVAVGRLMLALPFCPQPRFEFGGWHWLVGGVLFGLGLLFCGPGIPGLYIRPFTGPDEKVDLVTTGFYGIVRNPIYLGELLWCLGWSIMLRSTIGVALVPVWWAAFLLLVVIEEQSLERALGERYLAYRARVRGRILPGLPI